MAETIAPDGLLVQTNLTGSLTDIDDDPASPDGLWLNATDDGTDTVCRVSFASPSANLQTGAGLQTFRTWLRKSASGGTDPTVAIELYESGSLVASLSTGTSITSESGQTVSATWDASSLAGISGANVELRIVGSRSGGSPAGRRTVEVGAVAWDATVAASVHELGGAWTGAMSASADLRPERRLEGSWQGALSASAGLAVDRVLAGSWLGSLTSTGGLAGTQELEASWTAALTSVGDLSAERALGAAWQGDLSSSGLLDVERTLSGALSGSLTLSGSLLSDRLLAGSWQGGLTSTGNLTTSGGGPGPKNHTRRSPSVMRMLLGFRS